MSKKLSDYTLAELEERADYCGLRMHRSEAAVQMWLAIIHEAAKKRMYLDDQAYKRHTDVMRAKARGTV